MNKNVEIEEETMIFTDAEPAEMLTEPSFNYKPSRTRTNDLLHTRLEISFDYEKQYAYGKATLTLKPWFYPVKELKLDAKGMEIKEVSLADPATFTRKKLVYEYDNRELKIQLDREYTQKEKYHVYIDYISKPNEIMAETGQAITSDKGLYFINPTREDSTKPRQIWTQGETESNSVWFPTIDSPNEKMTQEFYITVDQKDMTLSNGELVYSKHNSNGTRTDLWKQDLPHAPYLAMLAVGEFAVVKDYWRDKVEVNYYVEPAYKPYAKMIFGNTPEMMEFFSKKLGVDYPWSKYSQVVVRDFVSGAMENTSAVVHFDGLQHDAREHLDETYESIISHELFHHWFGDLVTCESWANLPLNESFATYGEYLWIDYKYGRKEADLHLKEYLDHYLSEADYKQEKMIRFHYEKRDDLFDRHTYQKGGRILHMLRNYTGDEAFFAALNLYLNQNKFKTVEIHNLRLAFEEITGEDLNWFFNQWFFTEGHPELEVSQEYDETKKEYTVKVNQTQSTPFRLPVKIDIFENGKKRTESVEIRKVSETFTFKTETRPDWVNFDAEKSLLAVINTEKSFNEWGNQFRQGALFMDRYQAMDAMAAFHQKNQAEVSEMYYSALTDSFWKIREFAINQLQKIDLTTEKTIMFKNRLATLAANDPKSDVRRAAIGWLTVLQDQELAPVFRKASNDSSYSVMADAMIGLARIAPEEAVALAEKNLNSKNSAIITSSTSVISEYGTRDYTDVFNNLLTKKTPSNQYMLLLNYGNYLRKAEDSVVLKGLPILEREIDGSTDFFSYLFISGALNDLKDRYNSDIEEINSKIKKLKKGSPEIATLEAEKTRTKAILDKVVELSEKSMPMEESEGK